VVIKFGMPYLRKVTINKKEYFYLFHTVRDGKKYRKLSKYVGKTKPTQQKLKKLTAEFIEEIRDSARPKEKPQIRAENTI